MRLPIPGKRQSDPRHATTFFGGHMFVVAMSRYVRRVSPKVAFGFEKHCKGLNFDLNVYS